MLRMVQKDPRILRRGGLNYPDMGSLIQVAYAHRERCAHPDSSHCLFSSADESDRRLR
jgi:hypothetical protein